MEHTFGSVDQYKMLDFLTEKIALLPNNRKAYVSSVIQDFNLIVKKANLITDKSFKIYLLDLIHSDFKAKADLNISTICDFEIVNYFKNYVAAKIKTAKQ